MLRRKIIDQLSDWRADSRRKPVIIKGCRQCGKTYAAKAFAEANYDNVVYVNFFENPEAKDIFAGSLDIEQITMMASALLGSAARFVPGKTVLILDEIQECPQARTALKFFSVDGRYDVIGTRFFAGGRGLRRNAGIHSGWLRNGYRHASARFRGVLLGKRHNRPDSCAAAQLPRGRTPRSASASRPYEVVAAGVRRRGRHARRGAVVRDGPRHAPGPSYSARHRSSIRGRPW